MKLIIGGAILVISGWFLSYGFAFVLGKHEPQTDKEFGLLCLRVLFMGVFVMAGIGIAYLMSPDLFEK